MSKLEKIYSCSPVFLQNIMVSGQGAVFKQQRFNKIFYKKLGQAIERSTWSAERLEEYQVYTARDFLIHAGGNSRYWRRRFKDFGCDPAAFNSLDDIRKFPILEKSDLRERTAEIGCSISDSRKLVSASTSGTTGSPIHVAYTSQDVPARMAFLYRMFDLFGIEPMSRSVRLSGRAIFPNATTNRCFWRINWPMSQMLMSSYDLHPDNLREYVNTIARYRPVLIDGFPSSIYILARYINEQGEAGRIMPKVIMTTAETLEDYQRDEISKAFGGCPVINQYASAEGAPFITQDTNGELVVNTDSGIFEFVKPGTDSPARPGELAEMLLTSFNTHAYPLVRYRIGDTVVLPSVARLSQVWAMPVVEKVLGRQEDILYTPMRGYVGRLTPAFKKIPSTVVECQVIQVAPTKFLLKVVPRQDNEYRQAQLHDALQEMRARLGDVEIEIQECESLPRGANGKLRAVVGMAGEKNSH